MGESGSDAPLTPPWPEQTLGQRVVSAAWRAVAAHLAAADAQASPAADGAGDLDLPAAVQPAGHDRLR